MSQRGTLRITPGIATGVTEEPLKQPALPNEAPSPGLPGSTRNTLCPSRCSQRAAHTPTMPAPITPTRRARSPPLAAAIARLPQALRAAWRHPMPRATAPLKFQPESQRMSNNPGRAADLPAVQRRRCPAPATKHSRHAMRPVHNTGKLNSRLTAKPARVGPVGETPTARYTCGCRRRDLVAAGRRRPEPLKCRKRVPRPPFLIQYAAPPRSGFENRKHMAQVEVDRVERRLSANLAADVVGYSRLMGADEEG